MAKVICSLPNASEEIGGVKFISHRDGMISEEIDDAVAERFASITGYKLAPSDGGSAPAAPVAPAAVVEVAAPVLGDIPPDPDPVSDTPVRADEVPAAEAPAAPTEEDPAAVADEDTPAAEAAPAAPAAEAPAAAPAGSKKRK